MTKIPEPTVFVVDDDPDIRDALQGLLSLARLRVETHASAEEFLDAYQFVRPACLILDVRMPGLRGPDLHAHLLERSVDIPVIYVTGQGDVTTISRGFRMGAVDFLQKPFDANELLQRVRYALEKDEDAVRESTTMGEISRRFEMLSETERQVMELLTDGLLNKNIAATLSIAERTVEDRRARIMTKLKLGSVAELARMAERLHAWNSRTRMKCLAR